MEHSLWWEQGFHDVISVTPPDAALSSKSKLRDADRGKVPGRRNASGTWGGYDWLRHPTTREEVIAWQRHGASLGLRTHHYPALDIDILDAATVDGLADLAIDRLGWAPERVGRKPKRLMLYRTMRPFARMRVECCDPAGTWHLIEFLGAGQQCVVAGTHPKTGRPYRWSDAEFTAADLTVITPEAADQYLDAAVAWLQGRGWLAKRSGTLSEATRGEIVSPASLAGDPATIQRLIASLPNDDTVAPDRTQYLTIGTAIKAALPDDPDLAFDIWWEWCERWPGNGRIAGNAIETVEADWQRIVPPFRIGAPYLLDLARQHGYSDAVAAFATEPEILVPLPAPPLEDKSGAIPYSDAWLAARILQEHGANLRYCAPLGGWLSWDSQRWLRDRQQQAFHLAGKTLRAAGREALATSKKAKDAEADARRCASVNATDNALRYASASPSVNVPVEMFDADPWSLNTPAGVLDLKSGMLLPSDASRLFTRCTSVAPEHQTPVRWLQFLDEVTGCDPELVTYLQTLAGYCLTGVTREHMLAFFYGSGGNGKGTFLNTISKIMGDYAEVAAMDTFVSSRFDRHPAELAALVGARLVTAQETQEGRSWDEAKVKAITGGDKISARFMRENFFTYTPQFKLCFAGNHRPRLHNLDAAMRRRFQLVPFNITPRAVDKDLDEKLHAEAGGIMQWMLVGCTQWQRDGILVPRAVRQATETYFEDEDPLGRWLTEATEPIDDGGCGTRELFAAWRAWCSDRNERPGTERTFAQSMQQRGHEKWQDGTTRRHGFAGLRLVGPMTHEPSAAQREFEPIVRGSLALK